MGYGARVPDAGGGVGAGAAGDAAGAVGSVAVELVVRVAAGEPWPAWHWPPNDGFRVDVPAEVARANAQADRFYRLGAIQYQAALVARLCERDAQRRRHERRVAVQRRLIDQKWAVCCWFLAQDQALRRECGVR